MNETLTVINACIFFALVLVHLYWLIGGRWAIDGAVPTDRNKRKVFHPGPFGTFVVAVGLFLFAISNLIYGSHIGTPVPIEIQKYLIAVIGVIFIFRVIGDFKYIGIFKRYNGSVFAKRDTWIYIPLCFLIALSHVILVSCVF